MCLCDADVQQESVRKREFAGKLRDVKVMVDQTETWVYLDNEMACSDCRKHP